MSNPAANSARPYKSTVIFTDGKNLSDTFETAEAAMAWATNIAMNGVWVPGNHNTVTFYTPHMCRDVKMFNYSGK